MSYRMSDEEFKLLSDFIRNYAGLVFTGAQKALFQKRVKKRMDANKLINAKEYYHLLRFDRNKNDELKELINLITVNETYFFREAPQMEVFKKELLPALKRYKEKEKRIRIWSAACSIGAEPYTLAMLIYESGLFLSGDWKIEIFGTDINTNALNKARKGVYSPSAFRVTKEKMKKKFFEHKSGGLLEIKRFIKHMVKYSQVNLFNPSQMSLMRNMDLIFCRNVMIYFDAEVKKKVAEMLYNSLSSQGYLVIGQTESLFKVSALFEIKPMSKVLVYKRPTPQTEKKHE